MKPLLFVFALLLVFNQVAVSAQTGPKDEIKQPATDLDRVKVGQTAPDFTLEDQTVRTSALPITAAKRMSSWFFTAVIGDPIASCSSASCKAC